VQKELLNKDGKIEKYKRGLCSARKLKNRI